MNSNLSSVSYSENAAPCKGGGMAWIRILMEGGPDRGQQEDRRKNTITAFVVTRLLPT